MNHLVHLFLSGNDAKVIMGNLLYDFLAWKDLQKSDQLLDPGFDLHVMIDTFTDQHQIIKSGTKRLHPHFNKYAPVVVDIYYDHLLYLNWSSYSHIAYPEFSATVYERIRREIHAAPPDIAARLERMVELDWLDSYTSRRGMEFVFSRLTERTRQKKDFSKAVSLLYEHLDDYNREFNIFFPQLLEETKAIQKS